MSVAHLPPFGGSKARCLEQAPAEVRPHLRLMCDGIKLVRDSSASPKVSAGVDGFTTFTWTACDGPPQLSCYVNGSMPTGPRRSRSGGTTGAATAPARQRRDGWADPRQPTPVPTTHLERHVPSPDRHDNLVGSGPIWPFARAWANPGYVLAPRRLHRDARVGPVQLHLVSLALGQPVPRRVRHHGHAWESR